jgi:hypothetical protein
MRELPVRRQDEQTRCADGHAADIDPPPVRRLWQRIENRAPSFRVLP